MKKILYIVLGILVVIALGLLIFGKKKEVVAPVTSTTATGTTSTSSSASTAAAKQAAAKAAALPLIKISGGAVVKTTELSVGQTVSVTTSDPEGGFSFEPIQYDSSILSMGTHTHAAPANIHVVGTDTWQFTAIKTGTTGITITESADANKNTTKVLFTAAISVK